MSFEVGKTYRMKCGDTVEVCVILPAEKWIRRPGFVIGYRIFCDDGTKDGMPLMLWCDVAGYADHPDGDACDLVPEEVK